MDPQLTDFGMAHTFSRREFYELVWSKPMTHLAKELGVNATLSFWH